MSYSINLLFIYLLLMFLIGTCIKYSLKLIESCLQKRSYQSREKCLEHWLIVYELLFPSTFHLINFSQYVAFMLLEQCSDVIYVIINEFAISQIYCEIKSYTEGTIKVFKNFTR